MSWCVKAHKQLINPGDAVFIWRSGAEAGILATGTVLSGPAMLEQDGVEFAVQADRFDKEDLRVRLRIDEVFAPPLSRDLLKARQPDLSILRTAQGTNFAVTPEEAAIIREMLALATIARTRFPAALTAGREAVRGYGHTLLDPRPSSGRSSTGKGSSI